MAVFKCPIETCNVKLTGTIWEMTPMAIMHMEGSHNISFNEEEIAEIVAWQAHPDHEGVSWPKLFEKDIVIASPHEEEITKKKVEDWWKKLNG